MFTELFQLGKTKNKSIDLKRNLGGANQNRAKEEQEEENSSSFKQINKRIKFTAGMEYIKQSWVGNFAFEFFSVFASESRGMEILIKAI